jgi:hypothetical protein
MIPLWLSRTTEDQASLPDFQDLSTEWTGMGRSRVGRSGRDRRERGTKHVKLEKIAYRGWKNNLRINNGDAELIVTLDVGPRILSYRLAGRPNVFKEYPEQLGRSGESEWRIRGGHRQWTGPEDQTRTYALDNGPVKDREVDLGVVRFTPAPEAEYGLQKEIDVRLASSGSRVTVVHRYTNVGAGPADLAPWSVSVMAPGGIAIIPLPGKRPHPGSYKEARSAADYAANQLMAVWPYLDFQDPRWRFGTKFITLRQDPGRGPTKLGLAHKLGSVGYLNAGILFVKWFEYREGQIYPDDGVNLETFSNEVMLEIESLGPLISLDPGQSVEHTERWELFEGPGDVADEAEIEATIAPRLTAR